MRIRSALAGAALLAAAAAMPFGGTAQAYDDCKDGTIGGAAGTPPARGHIVVPIGAHPNVIYLDVREVMGSEYTFSIWLYQETNNTPDLQQGGNTADGPAAPVWDVAGHEDDPCNKANPDSIIF